MADLVEDSANDGEDSDNESDVDDDDEAEKELEFEKERQKELERKLRYDKEDAEEKDKQSKINQNWLARYKAVFFDGTVRRKIQRSSRIFLVKLNANRSIVFGPPDGANIKKRLEKLLDLRFVSSSSCSRGELKVFDPLIAEYKQARYDPAIFKYVEHHRNAFWQACKAAFYKNVPRSNSGDISTLVDHVLAADPSNKEAHIRVQSKAV